MRSRLIGAFFAMSASAAVTVSLGLGAAGPASASANWPRAHRATPECLVLPNCVSVYQFTRRNSPLLVLEATGAVSNAPVILSADDPADSRQDWTYIDLGNIGTYKAEGLRGTLGLTRFDLAHYGNDEMYQLEFSPAGIPSGFCAANVAKRMVLRVCNGSRFQTMISTNGIGGSGMSPLSYWYGLSVAPASVAAHHLTVTGSRVPGAQVTFSRPVISNNQFWQPG
jgi:hypothetical protein